MKRSDGGEQRAAGGAAARASRAAVCACLMAAPACGRHDIEEARARQAAAEASARAAASSAEAASAEAAPDAAARASFSALASTLAAMARAPGKTADGPGGALPDGTRYAPYTIAGCDLVTLDWDPKHLDRWGFTMRCPDLAPGDLAPQGGLDAIDDRYFVVTGGPLAGVFVDRNMIDPRIWTIATVARRMTYDASMFVFCAEGRVPGRRFRAEADVHAECQDAIEKRLARTYCKFEPLETKSGFDCGRTWKVRATCGKELFDENKVTRTFTCRYDAAAAAVTLALGP